MAEYAVVKAPIQRQLHNPKPGGFAEWCTTWMEIVCAEVLNAFTLHEQVTDDLLLAD